MISFLRKILSSFRLHQAKRRVFSSVIIGENSIISATANVKLLHGASKENIRIGNYFKLSGELIASHSGKINIADHCLVGPNCVVGAVNKALLVITL